MRTITVHAARVKSWQRCQALARIATVFGAIGVGAVAFGAPGFVLLAIGFASAGLLGGAAGAALVAIEFTE